MSFRILLEKETQKFSCSHFTIFGANDAEALHGHNYYVSAEFGLKDIDPDLGMAFDFNTLKPLVKRLTDSFDEHVLLPLKSKFLTIRQTSTDVTISFKDKHYLLPAKDCLLLDVVNITSEELAREFAKRLIPELKKFPMINRLTVGIQETRGQTVFYDTLV